MSRCVSKSGTEFDVILRNANTRPNIYSFVSGVTNGHSSPNTEAPFKENVDQLFSSYILLNETSQNDAL